MKSSDEDDFRAFVNARSGDLMRRAFVLTGGDQHAAEDLVQTALAKAADHWSQLDHPLAFVRTVMYRQQISWHRLGWSKHESAAETLPEPAMGDRSHLIELKLAVRGALGRLSPRQRAVLFLRHFEDLPESEVAEVLGCSVGNVRSTNHRALQRLREVAPELADFYGRRVDRTAPGATEVPA